MGDYISETDLNRRLSAAVLVQMTDDDGVGVVDSTVTAAVIADAEAEVSAYLQERYTLPLASVPALLERLAVDVAVWHLYGRRQLVEESVETRYKAAVKLLERIAEGKISLGVEDPPSETGGSPSGTKDDDDRTFTSDSLDGF